MSDGGIQEGYTFWATIKITRAGLSKEQLQEAMGRIRSILAAVDGYVVNSTQTDTSDPVISIEMRRSTKWKKLQRELRKKRKDRDNDD
jgi:AmiR/NasT family two-component response regulator